jgi:putative ABC transport system ATP-binding protein
LVVRRALGHRLLVVAASATALFARTGAAMITVEGLSKTYRTGHVDVHALKDVSFHRAGRRAAGRGRSGSGKTTLLNLIGGLDAPESGRVVVGEHEVSTLGEAGRQRMRRETVGFVFQSFGLIPVLSAL